MRNRNIKKHLKLFKAGNDSQTNACVNFMYDMSGGYIQGYRFAGDILSEYVINRGEKQDYLIYPIAFLYRHHIEILLKDIIRKGSMLLEDKTVPPESHSLCDLWSSAKDVIEKIWEDDSYEKEFKKIEAFLNEFHSIDPKSDGFRYTHRKKDKHSKKPERSLDGIKIINIRQLYESVKRISDFLDGARTGINQYLSEIPNSLIHEK